MANNDDNNELFVPPSPSVSPCVPVSVSVGDNPIQPPVPKTTRKYKKKTTLPAKEREGTEVSPAIPLQEPELKPKKEKRKLSTEQYQRLCDNLKRGRLTSELKRKKNAQLRKIDKEAACEADDEKIFVALEKKRQPSKLKEENDKLIQEMADLKETITKMNTKVVAPKKEPAKLIQVLETPVIIPPPPIKAEPKKISARQQMKLMRGL